MFATGKRIRMMRYARLARGGASRDALASLRIAGAIRHSPFSSQLVFFAPICRPRKYLPEKRWGPYSYLSSILASVVIELDAIQYRQASRTVGVCYQEWVWRRYGVGYGTIRKLKGR